MGRSFASMTDPHASMLYLRMLASAQAAALLSHWPPEAALYTPLEPVSELRAFHHTDFLLFDDVL